MAEDAPPVFLLATDYCLLSTVFRNYPAEGAAVDGAAAVGFERGPVVARAVADVAREAVVRELRVVVAHERVAVGLGEDGGGGDGGRGRVAADDGLLRQGRLAQLQRVD